MDLYARRPDSSWSTWLLDRVRQLTLGDLAQVGVALFSMKLAWSMLRYIDAMRTNEMSGAAPDEEQKRNLIKLRKIYALRALNERQRRRKLNASSTSDDNTQTPDEPLQLPTLNSHEWAIASGLVLPDELGVDGFDAIGGHEDAKQQLQELLLLPLLRPELFANSTALGKLPSGVLLFGPPGTGKTMMAKAVAKECNMAFLNVSLPKLNHGLLGESEKAIHAVFTLAEKVAPCIVFIDEIDCLMGSRDAAGHNSHETTLRQKSIFMTDWDGLVSRSAENRVVLLAATNRPYSLDEAVQRRMPIQIRIGLPDVEQRQQILTIQLQTERLALPIAKFTLTVAELTEGFSGSDLAALVHTAARIPLREMLSRESASLTSPDANDADEQNELRPLTISDFKAAMKTVAATGERSSQYEFERARRQLELKSSGALRDFKQQREEERKAATSKGHPTPFDDPVE